MVFAKQPVAGLSGSALTTQPILVYLDGTGNVVTAATAAISGSAPAGGTLSSCTDLVPSLGYIHVSNCTFAGLDTLANTYYLVFTGAGSRLLTVRTLNRQVLAQRHNWRSSRLNRWRVPPTH